MLIFHFQDYVSSGFWSRL